MSFTWLSEWAESHNLLERTSKGFSNYMDNWKKDNRGDFFATFRGKSNLKMLQTEFQSYQFTHLTENPHYVSCTLNIRYLNEYIANYSMIFTLDGEVQDDLMDFDKLLANTIREGTVKVELIVRARKLGYSAAEVAQLVDLDEETVLRLY
ncbi:hypothetical protein [Paenibacillus radicis (ex Gao et al. 2016)]|uniref:Uncharacterized protein n=1 Tax=Paenibacillus radicis (ex Gao et al. 2016) TaxID=1737354 RepID=A0A917HQL3_9BACL|nr:hypothetical protein [Paenibacillus radicis (ex Gao et al. 2016)]GGG87109.1 hypothetical protein GCM10010918_51720 [Paenibacillus radicis (ex Gao et al. 2016)]